MSSSETDAPDEVFPTANVTERHWPIFGHRIPKKEIVFFCQIIVIYTVIVWSLYNLTTGGDNQTLWVTLVSASLGAILPNPSLKRDGV